LDCTVDRKGYPGGPMACYEQLRKECPVARMMTRLREGGQFTGRFVYWVEFQGGEWVHYHVMVQLTEQGARGLREAYRTRRGKGVIAWKDAHVADAWGRGFVGLKYDYRGDGSRFLGYSVGYGVKSKDLSQVTLPSWWQEYRVATGKTVLQKFSASRATSGVPFWEKKPEDDELAGVSKSAEGELRSELSRKPVDVRIEECGKSSCNVVVRIPVIGGFRYVTIATAPVAAEVLGGMVGGFEYRSMADLEKNVWSGSRVNVGELLRAVKRVGGRSWRGPRLVTWWLEHPELWDRGRDRARTPTPAFQGRGGGVASSGRVQVGCGV